MKKMEMCKLIKARSGMYSVVVKQPDAKSYHMHSSIDPVKEADEWLSKITLEEHTAYIVLGCGLGYHVRALWDKLPKTSLLCVFLTETEVNLVTRLKTQGPLYTLQHKRLVWLKTDQFYDIVNTISHTMLEFDIKKIELCKYYPAMRLNTDFYASCEQDLTSLIGKNMALNVNVKFSEGRRHTENYWHNIPYISTSPGIIPFENLFQGWPCIVVASGPSLNKNITVLKECLPYAVVIAAGSTIAALHKHGIQPHFLVVIDASPEMFAALDGYCNDQTVLLASVKVYHQVVELYPGRRCFALNHNDAYNLFTDYLPDTAILQQTASVATVAVDFARHLGAEKIIMVGQDLAFAGKQHHADGVKAGAINHELVEVPGYYGGKVSTVYIFKIVIEYLESYLLLNPNICFINATEGGAKIAGMEQLALAEVKKTFLGIRLPVKERIDNIYDQFSTEITKIDGLIHEMINCQQRCGNIAHLIENYDQEHPYFRVTNINEDNAVLTAKAQELHDFFDEITNHVFAPYFKIFLNPRLQAVEFYRQDDSHISVVYSLYVQVFNDFQQFIRELSQWIQEATAVLEKMRHGMDRYESE